MVMSQRQLIATVRLTKETHPHQVMVATKQVQIVEGMRVAKETDQLHLMMVVKAVQTTKVSLLLQALQLIQEIRRIKLLLHLLNRGEQEMRQHQSLHKGYLEVLLNHQPVAEEV